MESNSITHQKLLFCHNNKLFDGALTLLRSYIPLKDIMDTLRLPRSSLIVTM